MKYAIFCIFLLILSTVFVLSAYADTVYLNDGGEIKGIVVENYHNRIVLSTFEGEKELDKISIKDIVYDRREQNFIKLGDYHKEKGNLTKAYSYYKKAYEINPNYKEARDKFVYIRSALLRNPERQMRSDIARKQALFKESGKVYSADIKRNHNKPENELVKKVGISLYSDKHMPKVSSVTPLSPASQCGIEKGDIIFSLWGRMTGYLDLDTIADMMVDDPSPEISLVIKRRIHIPRSNTLGQGTDNSGMSLEINEEGLMIKSIRRGSDAAKSGLLERDIITNINEESTRYMPLDKAILNIEESFKSDNLKIDILRSMSLWRKEN
jgi:C-terminal processing protease CtpA/Prc